MKDVTIGVDLAKSVFQVYGATMTGEVLFGMRLPRGQRLALYGRAPACRRGARGLWRPLTTGPGS